jgi:hypothetical protein
MNILMILTGLNSLLILALIAVYAKNIVRMRSTFSVGLLIFALLFLTQNIASFYYYITMMPYFAQGLETYALIFNVLQLLAFAVLNWLTWK